MGTEGIQGGEAGDIKEQEVIMVTSAFSAAGNLRG